MQADKVAEVTPISLKEIKEMGAVSGPCISIFIPVDPAPDQVSQNKIRTKHALDQVEKALGARSIAASVSQPILGTLRSVLEDLHFDSKTVAVYCAPDFCRAFQLAQDLGEAVTVADHFVVKPLIPALNADRHFYILTLSQKHVRLLRCTQNSSEEVPLADSTAKSLWEDKSTDQPDHDQDNTSSAGSGNGAMKGVAFTTNTDSEAHLEYLSHFYKHLSEGVTSLLKSLNGSAPLVIAGVDYETACFRRVNVYPNLVEEPVHGAADGLKGGELHKRALDAMQSYWAMPLKAALARFDQLGGSDRTSTTVKDIVKAAFQGRVLDLILAAGAGYMGVFHEATHDVKGHKQPETGDEDLLNVAALQTILHAGQVFVVPAAQVPHGAPAIAVYRY